MARSELRAAPLRSRPDRRRPQPAGRADPNQTTRLNSQASSSSRMPPRSRFAAARRCPLAMAAPLMTGFDSARNVACGGGVDGRR